MRIKVHCPKCGELYHLEPEMEGRRTRCPNSVCREVFVVTADGEGESPEPPPPPRPSAAPPSFIQNSGSVGDLVPILPVEEATQEPMPEPRGDQPKPKKAPSPKDAVIPMLPTSAAGEPAYQANSWEMPPPVRRQPAAPAAPPRQAPAPAPAPPTPVPAPRRKKAAETVKLAPPKPVPADPKKTITAAAEPAVTAAAEPAEQGVKELPPGAWEAPPIRRGMDDSHAAETQAAIADSAGTIDLLPAPASRRLAPLVIIVSSLLFLGAVGFGWLLYVKVRDTEKREFEIAHKEYKERKFRSAADKFQALVRGQTASDDVPRYQFFADLSNLLDAVNQFNADSPKAYDQLRDFCQANDDNALLKEKDQTAFVGESFCKSAEDIAERAAQGLSPEMLAKAREAVKWCDRYKQEAGGDEKFKKIRERIAEVDLAIANKKRYDEALAAITKEADRPTAETLGKITDIFQRLRIYLPDLDRDPKVQEQLNRIASTLRANVQWKDGGSALTPKERSDEETEPSLLVVPSTFAPTAALADNVRVVFALARGVLYALEQSTGRVQWATRVGIDTTALPLRLPATEISPEIALVLSSDTNALTARDAQTGQPYWHHRLSSPCLGKPVIVDKRAYVPTYDGKVHVIEIIEGKLLGWYDLRQPLSVGGIHQEGTKYLYFPAEHRSIFVIDKENRDQPCVAILQSGHPSGSLRSEPIIISRDELRNVHKLDPAVWPDYLILSQADGLNSTKLRVFALPITSSTSPPLLSKEPQVKGWSWFAPYHNGERLVQVTDAGVLGLIGIKQVHNLDRDLFLETQNEIILSPQITQPGRAQIVHAVEDDLWVLAKGDLQLLHFDRFGQKVSPLWQQPLPLGSPLHASQVVEGKLLVVVTQLLQRPVCLASAVDAALEGEAGVVRWQRQLGFVGQGEPLQVGEELVALDEGGSLFVFDAKKHPHRSDLEWQTGGQILDTNPVELIGPSYLLPSRDGKSVYAIGSAKGRRLNIRRYETGKRLSARTPENLAPLAGAPAIGDDGMVLALADGQLAYVSFDETKRPMQGPEWRARTADKQAPGYVVYLGNGEYLVTNGQRGLTRMRWDGGPLWETTTVGEVPDRIAAAPLVLPRADAADDVQVCVVDGRGNLLLVRERGSGGDRNRTWSEARRWTLNGRVTAGPLVRGGKIGCIVDNQRLIFIDPERDQLLWEYRRDGENLIGPPQLVGDSLLVAHRNGLFIGLDPKTGKPQGPGYRLRAASVAPTATPVAFGPGRAFAPLTDGTVLLLSLKQVRHPLREFPSGF